MAEDGNNNGTLAGLGSTLTNKELLASLALSAAAALATTRGPALLKQLGSATEGKGEEEAEKLGQKGVEGAKKQLQQGKGGLAGKALSKALGSGGGSGGGGGKKTRRLPIQRWTDVAVPVDRAYEAWTRFERFPEFMHRVLSVEQEDDDRVRWQEKIWFSKRDWVGKITDRRKNDRIAWKTESGTSHSGIVSFHRLAPNLTRVMVTIEFEPTGMIEKMASGLRFVKRAVQSDLARFKAFVEMHDAEGIEYRPVGDGNDEDEKEERDAA